MHASSIVIIIILRLANIPRTILGPNFGWVDLTFIVLAQVEQHLVVINALFPSLRSFLDSTSTGFLDWTQYSPPNESIHNSGVGLKDLTTSGSSTKRPHQTFARAGSSTYTANVAKAEHDRRSFDSNAILVCHSVDVE